MFMVNVGKYISHVTWLENTNPALVNPPNKAAWAKKNGKFWGGPWETCG